MDRFQTVREKAEQLKSETSAELRKTLKNCEKMERALNRKLNKLLKQK